MRVSVYYAVKFVSAIFVIILLVSGNQYGFSQSFANLNFESANVSGNSGGYVSTSAALPGWVAYYGTVNNPTSVSTPIVAYNGFTLGAVLVAIQDTNAIVYGPIGGKYSALLQGSIPFATSSASIGQTGTIPSTAHSLTFFGNLAANVQGQILQLSFNGLNVPYSVVGSGTGYGIYGADISAYAGQIGQLLFTTPIQTFALLDNIQFSNQPIPEPSGLALFGISALLVGFFRRRNSSQ